MLFVAELQEKIWLEFKDQMLLISLNISWDAFMTPMLS